ncbi:MAG TPA: hypothetical protein VFW33_09050, partial [Gemmataceae bacterium]|nr:hypothetical protein [Gemmataceae bacterium]
MARTHRSPRREPRPRQTRPHIEGLEPRCLLSVAPAANALFHETLDAALPLGAVVLGGRAQASGAIGGGPAGAADVSWYKFSLPATADVRLAASPGTALGLYNDAPPTYDPDLFAYLDPYTPTFHRLLAQSDPGPVVTGPAGPTTIDRLLAPGTYWVAVSGSGNDDFYPFLAGSGLPGRTGSYSLTVAAADPGAGYDDPAVPVVLASDPAPGATLDYSPFILRFNLNAAPDPAAVAGYKFDPGSLARLAFNTAADFGPDGGASDVTDQYLGFGTVTLEPRANELQITPFAPLASGYYQVTLPGYGPNGSDYVAQFRVAGPAGNADYLQQPGTWTGTAYEIPDVADGRLHRLTGAVGTDPTDPSGFYQAGVEIYHFTVPAGGTYSLGAEVFAGRIGSPLDAALSLYKVDDQGNTVFYAANGDSANTTAASNGQAPLFTDPALNVPLGPGEYYLAVSSGSNYPNPDDPNSSGYFDPTVPQSGSTGISKNITGPYVLDVLVQPLTASAPRVVAVTPDTGPGGNGPLTGLRVRFDQPVNLLGLATRRYLQTAPTGVPDGGLSSVTLTDAAGHPYDVRLASYDNDTNTATLILLDPVPAGEYTLHLSGTGPEAIAGASGVPLDGGEFSTTFAVAVGGNTERYWTPEVGFDSPQNPQPVPTLFPRLVSQGVTLARDTAAPAKAEDDYSVVLLQSRNYSFVLTGGPGLTVTVLDATGAVDATITPGVGLDSLPALLSAGTYTVRVTWTDGPTPYQLQIGYFGAPDNPTPLVSGPAPAVQVRLDAPPPAPAPTPP